MGHDNDKSSMMNGPFAATRAKAQRRKLQFDAWLAAPPIVAPQRRFRRLAARGALASAFLVALACSDEKVKIGGPGVAVEGAPQGGTADHSFLIYYGEHAEKLFGVVESRAPEQALAQGAGGTSSDGDANGLPGLRQMGDIDFGDGPVDTGDVTIYPNTSGDGAVIGESVTGSADFDILTWGAAMQCAKEKYEEEPFADIAAIDPRPWYGYSGQAWYHFDDKREGPTWSSCDDILYHQELTLCIAEKLDEAANAVTALTWDAPGVCGTGEPWAASPHRLECNVDDWSTRPWTVPPQSEKNVFIARDKAIRALANLALFEYEIPDNFTGEPQNCTIEYERVLDDPSVVDDDLGLLFSMNGTTTELSPQVQVSEDNVVELTLNRMARKANVLSGAGQLLEKLLREGVEADIEYGRANSDTLDGRRRAWGVYFSNLGEYPGYAHALKTILGRIEPQDDFAETWLDPNDSNHEYNQLDTPSRVPYCSGDPWLSGLLTMANGPFVGYNSNGRWDDAPASNNAQTSALMMLDKSGIVFPVTSLDISAAKEAVADQLLYQAATDLELDGPDDDYNGETFRASTQAQAISDSVDEISENDWAWAFGVAASSYQYLTQVNPRVEALLPDPDNPPGGITLADPTSPLVSALDGVVIAGGMPLADIAADPMSLAAYGQTASQCNMQEDKPRDSSCEMEDASCLAYLSTEIDRVQSFQNAFVLGDVLRRRLAAMAEKVKRHDYAGGDEDTAQAVTGLAASGAAQMRSWASQGRMVQFFPGQVWLLGVQPDDFGLQTVDQLKQNFVFVYGEPWMADCAAGIRETCPENFQQDYVQVPSQVTELCETSSYYCPSGNEGVSLNMQVNGADQIPNFDPPQTPDIGSNDTGKHIYVISRSSPDDPNTGFVVGALAANEADTGRWGTVDVVSARQREYIKEILGVPLRTYQIQPEPPPCAEVPDDFFVPLENELTSDSDAFESSWRHYLTLAEEAAARADELGREAIGVGKEMDARREQANEEIAGICGDYGALDDIDFEVDDRGTLRVGDDSEVINECIGEPVFDVVFLTTDPFISIPQSQNNRDEFISDAIKADFLGCNGSQGDDPLCDEDVITYAALGLAESTYLAPSEASCIDAAVAAALDADAGNRGAVIALGSRPDTRMADLSSALAGARLEIVDDTQWHWELRAQDALLMSTKDQDYWPACEIGTDTCDSAPLPAAQFRDAFSVETDFTPDWPAAERDAYFKAVANRLWMLGAVTGHMPPNRIVMPVPGVNWSSSAWTQADREDPEGGAHVFTTYGAGYFVKDGNDYWLDTEWPLLQEQDRLALGAGRPIDIALAWDFEQYNTTRPQWFKDIYHQMGLPPDGTNHGTSDAYLHFTAGNAAVQFRQDPNRQDDLLGAFAAHEDICEGSNAFCLGLGWDWNALLATNLTITGDNGVTLPTGFADKEYEDRLCETADGLDPVLTSSALLYDEMRWDGSNRRDPANLFSNWPYTSNTARLIYSWITDTESTSSPSSGMSPECFRATRFTGGPSSSDLARPLIPATCLNSFNEGGDVWLRNTMGALGPSHCGPDKRVRAFSDGTFGSGGQMTLNEYRARLSQAVAVACAVNDRFSGVPSGLPLPVLSEPADLGKLRVWLKQQARGSRNALTYIALRQIPKRVVDDFKNGLVGVGDISGELGQQILNLENSLRSVSNNWVSLEGDFDALANAVDGAQLGLTAVDLQANQASIRLSMERMQNNALIAKGIANAAGGIASMFTGNYAGGANQTANAAIDIALGVSLRAKLAELADVQNEEQANQTAQVINDLEKIAIPTYTNMRTTLEELRVSSAGAIGWAAQRRDLKQRGLYAAAKGIGSQFFQNSEGQAIELPLNTVLGREYDLAVARYERALQHAQRMAYVAKLAIEQRLGVRMRSLTGEIPGYGIPADWELDMCDFQGINYDDLRTGQGLQWNDNNQEVVVPFYNSDGVSVDPGRHEDPYIGDFIQRLRQFVEYYNLNEPMHEEDDMTVLSLRDDLLPPQGTTCYDDGANLLYFSSALTGAYTKVVEGEDPATVGWNMKSCTVDNQNCLRVAGSQGLLDGDGASQGLPPGSGSGGFSWLHNVALEIDENNPPESGDETPQIPSRSVFQDVQLQGGVGYTLSWWDMARGADGGAEADGIQPYNVTVYDSDWNVVTVLWSDVPYYEEPGGAWSERRLAEFTPSDTGTHHLVFRAADADAAASLLIADVQLERSLGSNQPSAYVDTSASRLVVSSDCVSGSPEEFRDAFDYHCDGNDDCWYELKSNVIIDTQALNSGLSRLRGKLARGNYNYRHVDLALNFVGTGVLDCGGQSVESCYGSGYVEYTLQHDASSVPLLGPDGSSTVFDFGTATIPFGKALATERYLTLPLGSADQGLISQLELQKTQLSGRPLDGQYRLKVHDSPALEWGRLEDVQFVIRYRYWSEVDNGAGPNF